MNEMYLAMYGNIPRSCDVDRGKTFLSEVQKYSEDGSETLLSVTEKRGVVRREELIEEGDHLTRADSLRGYKKCKQGDLVVNIMLAWKRGLGVAGESGIVSPAYAVFRPDRGKMDPRYLDYLVRTDEVVSLMKAFSYGVVDSRLRIYPDRLLALPFLRPPISQQTAIADFLDGETSRIDKLIDRKTGLVELLEEKCTALITRSVTKGLDPDIPMRDSGVEWLGEIPEHWDVSTLGRVVMEFFDYRGQTPRKLDMDWGGRIPAISASNVRDGYLDLSRDVNYASDELYSRWMRSGHVEKGDILFTTEAPLGNVALVPDEKRYLLSQRVILLRTRDDLVHNRFLFQQMRCSLFEQRLQRDATGSTAEGISRSKFSMLPIAVPPLCEQRAIALVLEDRTADLTHLVRKVQQAVCVLREYRSALIAAAVTGKIDVRDGVAA